VVPAVGGNLGMVGSLDAVNRGTVAASVGGHGGLVAVGLDPEGINQNAVYWEFVTDSSWRDGLANTSAYLEVGASPSPVLFGGCWRLYFHLRLFIGGE
jgi:alpha-N-acetylglucosaminidase